MEHFSRKMDVDVAAPVQDRCANNSDDEMVHISSDDPFDIFDPSRVPAVEEEAKKEERAKRFGLRTKSSSDKSETEAINDLYASMGIAQGDDKDRRLNVLHLRGTRNMYTEDVFQYFQDYPPVSIEWINDVSCNVVWRDDTVAARALHNLSKPMSKSHDERGDGEADRDEIGRTPGHWRKGFECPKSRAIVMRFASRKDKNPTGTGGELAESKKSMVRQMRWRKRKRDGSLRMAAIDEEQDDVGCEPQKNPWGTLSQTWGKNDSVEDDFRQATVEREHIGDVRERLGVKSRVTKEIPVSVVATSRLAVEDEDEDEDEQSSSEGSDEEWCRRSKVPRMRMRADDEEMKALEKRIKLKAQKWHENERQMNRGEKISTDLRTRLNHTKKQPAYRDPIQVVVTNVPMGCQLPLSPPPLREDETIESEELEEGEWPENQTEEEATPADEQEQEEPMEELQVESEDSDDSQISEKEVQGPKGSVIKVVPRVKPRVASTVWARLNDNKPESNDRLSSHKTAPKEAVKGDLRSRLGYHNRGRSPLRIEVKNDKYAEDESE